MSEQREALAKVAKVLATTIEPESYRRTPPPDRVSAYVTTLAAALAPLLDEFRAEAWDEGAHAATQDYGIGVAENPYRAALGEL